MRRQIAEEGSGAYCSAGAGVIILRPFGAGTRRNQIPFSHHLLIEGMGDCSGVTAGITGGVAGIIKIVGSEPVFILIG